MRHNQLSSYCNVHKIITHSMKYRIVLQDQAPAATLSSSLKTHADGLLCIALNQDEIVGYAEYLLQPDSIECIALNVQKQHIGRGILAGIILKLENSALAYNKDMLMIGSSIAKPYEKYFSNRGFVNSGANFIKKLNSKSNK